MITTILADNEVWVCKLITTMVNWEELGFSIIATAHNGAELYSLVKEKNPDLIITDIQMSGMTGLEVLEKLHNENINTPSIIISGYDDFNYAKKAIDLNVFTYLLKPLDEPTLTKALREFRNSISKTEAGGPEIDALKQQFQAMSQHYLHIYLKNLLNGETNILSVAETNSRFNTNFHDGSYCFLLLALDSKIRGQAAETKSFMYVTDAILSALKPLVYEQEYLKLKNFWAIFINYNPDNQELIFETLNKLIAITPTSNPSLVLSSHITLGIGNVCPDLSNLRISYASALNAVHARLTLGTDRLISLNGDIGRVSASLSLSTKNMISTYMNSYSTNTTADALATMILDNYKQGMSPNALYDLVHSALTLAVTSLPIEIHDSYEASNDGAKIIELLESLEHCSNVVELKKESILLLEKLRALNSALKNESSAIYKLKTYISENLDKDISLNDLAQLVNYNPNYLSDYFKKETGENVNKYIMHLRIEKAKHLLSDPKVKCKDVAINVGYKDLNYFTRIFKTAIGITPKEYQKIFARK